MPPTSPAAWLFLVDEDMPRSTGPALRSAGYDAVDARDVGLGGQPDSAVFAYAQSHGRIILTADKGFANILQFPLGTHAGIVVVRFPNTMPTTRINQEIVSQLTSIQGQSLVGALAIIDPGWIRLRRAP